MSILEQSAFLIEIELQYPMLNRVNKHAKLLFGTSEYCPTEHGAESLLDTY